MKIIKALPLVFLLCLCICLLTGCGSGETAPAETPAAEQPQSQAAEELVYAARFREIPLDRDMDLEPLAYTDSGFYKKSQ